MAQLRLTGLNKASTVRLVVAVTAVSVSPKTDTVTLMHVQVTAPVGWPCTK